MPKSEAQPSTLNPPPSSLPQAGASVVYNIAVGERTTLNDLYRLLRELLSKDGRQLTARPPVYRDFRPGDIQHSLADITQAREQLGYRPTHSIAQGLTEALSWYQKSI